MTDKIISQEQLKEFFDYKDGNLYWKIKKCRNVAIGQKAGSYAPRGNIDIMINGKVYKAHRLIFLFHYGYLPKILDHKDGNPLNNKIENLREATNSQNMCNTKLNVNNKSGEKGVIWDKRISKWRTFCTISKKQYTSGSYSDLDKAIESVRKLRESLHMEFARHK
jgi:hypothetical protein